jgi:RsiW-degrading membrane proteinase PrsW (M82 family)
VTDTISIFAAAAGGILPVFAWLWFWLREDRPHPEPRRLIALAFAAGMATVAIVIPLENLSAGIVHSVYGAGAGLTLIFITWSIIEEVCKYLMAEVTVLWRREDDEPIDPSIYLITVALGFSALENTLFLLSPLSGTTTLQLVQTGDLRFVGATLLHVLSSAVVGVSLGLSFYGTRAEKVYHAITGVVLAACVHGTFNYLIMHSSEDHLLGTFALVWVGVVGLLAMLEYIKRIRPRVPVDVVQSVS